MAMFVTQNVLDELRQIGLNLYERKLWVALLSRGTSTAGELSSLAKVPHSRTYDVLESLAEKGFVMIQNAKPLRYVAMAPSESLERVKKKIMENTELTVDRINQFQKSAHLRELDKIYKKGMDMVEPGEIMGSLRGRTAMYQQIETCIKNAKNSISIMTTSKGLTDLQQIHGEMLRKAAEKGVKIRIAAQYGKENTSIIEKLKSFAEIKKISRPDITGRFCVVDGSHVVMALTDEDVHPTQDLGLWTQSEHVAADVLQPIFDFLWQKIENA
jgi:sugar-specific transcriptional regulator TrmB